MTNKYRVLFQAHSDALAVLADTDDLEFARRVMIAAFQQFACPGQKFNFLLDEPKKMPYEYADAQGKTSSVYEHYEQRPVFEPIIALYESVGGKWEWKESCGWTEEGAQD